MTRIKLVRMRAVRHGMGRHPKPHPFRVGLGSDATELLNTRTWRTQTELSTEIFDWIEVFYNRTRRHSSLGMLAPSPMKSSTPPTPAPPDSHNPSPTSGDRSPGPLTGDPSAQNRK